MSQDAPVSTFCLFVCRPFTSLLLSITVLLLRVGGKALNHTWMHMHMCTQENTQQHTSTHEYRQVHKMHNTVHTCLPESGRNSKNSVSTSCVCVCACVTLKHSVPRITQRDRFFVGPAHDYPSLHRQPDNDHLSTGRHPPPPHTLPTPTLHPKAHQRHGTRQA